MPYLLIVTAIWAFSFSLIGEYLAGHVDSYFAVLTRIVIAGLLFVPLTRWRGHAPAFVRGMLLIGALQFGITYVCLYLSFSVLTVPEVLLFTILTPLHVTLIEDALNRRFNPWALVAAAVAVLGAGMMGVGIAHALALNGVDVMLKDVSLEAAERGLWQEPGPEDLRRPRHGRDRRERAGDLPGAAAAGLDLPRPGQDDRGHQRRHEP